MKILSADDVAESRYLLEFTLRSAGHEVVSVQDGEEALAAAERDRFDLVISDVLMPRMDGFQLCRELKRRPATRGIPFVFYTATYTEEKDAELGLRLGAARFVVKPQKPQDLLDVVRGVMEQSGKQESARVAEPSEVEFLATYEQRLARKLDTKVAELRALSVRLQEELAAKEREIAERRLAETALRQREAFYHAVLERSPDVAAVVETSGRFKFLSSSVRMVLGWTEEDMAGFEKFVDLVHPDDRDRVAEIFGAIVSRPEGLEGALCRMRHKDGSFREVAVTGRNLLGDPAVEGVIVNARDVTEIRRVEDRLHAAQKLEMVGRLAGGVAHDFNNILTVILSCGEALRRQVSCGEIASREDVEQVNSAAERARDITRQLLGFARRQVIIPRPLDLNRVIEGAQGMLARLAGEDVQLTLDLEEGLWPVRLDQGQVDQILLNLVANARDALPRGGRVEITTRNLELGGSASTWPGATPGQYVGLQVSDDGTGMTPEVRERVFDPFFTTKVFGRGTGLGLATVHGIVSQNGGQVRVESELGRGSRFELLFPRTEEREVMVSGESPSDEVTGGTETILLVEDDPAVRRQALRALADGGYCVHMAGDGLEALEVVGVSQGHPHLLLTDVVMPSVDGPRLAEIVRERWPGIRVLFMSGYTDDRLTARGVLTPGVDLLQKPFTGTELLRRVRAVLDRPD